MLFVIAGKHFVRWNFPVCSISGFEKFSFSRQLGNTQAANKVFNHKRYANWDRISTAFLGTTTNAFAKKVKFYAFPFFSCYQVHIF